MEVNATRQQGMCEVTGPGNPRSAPAQFRLGADSTECLASAGIVMVTFKQV
jgi:hypothetical protein